MKENNNSSIVVYILRTLYTLLISSVIGVLLISVFYCIPDNTIRENAMISVEQIEKENGTGIKEWPLIYSHAWSGKMDSGTDYKDLHDILSDYEMDPFHRALNGAGSSRYWKGWYGFLRFLLIFLSYGQIRWFVGSILFILAWMISIKIKDKLGLYTSFSFVIALILTNCILVPFSVHMSICIIIALSGMLWVLYKYSRSTQNIIIWEFFLILGILTSYLDELMVPLLTLGMPLLMILLCNLIEYGSATIRKSMKTVIIASLSWTIGYAVFWAMKWCINIAFLGTEASRQTEGRLQFWLEQDAEEGGRLYTVAKNVMALLPTHGENLITIFVCIIIIVLMMLVYLLKSHPNITKDIRLSVVPVLIVSLYPFLWYVVMYKHSLVHATLFSYHDLMITIFGILTVYFYIVRGLDRTD